jgi:hypothetical protein
MASSRDQHFCCRNVFIPALVQRQSTRIEAAPAVSASSFIARAHSPEIDHARRPDQAPLAKTGNREFLVALAQ